MRNISFCIGLIFLMTHQLHAQASPSAQDLVQQEINAYANNIYALITPVHASYEAMKKCFEAQRVSEMEKLRNEVISSCNVAGEKLKQTPPYKNENFYLTVAQQYVKIALEGANVELKEIITIYQKVLHDEDDGEEIDKAFQAISSRLTAFEGKLNTGKEQLFISYWAPLIGPQFCEAVHAYVNSASGRFENIKGSMHQDLIATWFCNPVFPGCRTCYISDMENAEVNILFMDSADFNLVNDAHYKLFLYIRSCALKDAVLDHTKILNQPEVDSGKTSEYVFTLPNNLEARIALKKSVTKYEIRLNLKKE